MAGILNNKERVMDLLITREGRRQAAAFTFRPRFASFTDLHTFYQESGSNGVADPAGSRIFFEASNRFQDVIIPELEPGTRGKISGLFRAGDFQISGKTVADGTILTGAIEPHLNVITGSKILASSARIMSGIFKNIDDLRIVKTEDTFSMTSGFSINKDECSFEINDFTRWNDITENGVDEISRSGIINIDSSKSIFQDERFSHLPNFKYLPPLNATDDPSVPAQPMGNYANLMERPILRFSDLQETLKNRNYVEVDFLETSVQNNIASQCFEFSNDGVEKLSIVDFGIFPDADPGSPDKHVFFIGKVYRDSTGSDTFLNIFTLVFD